MQKVKQLLDYAATRPDAILTYHASDMLVAGHSDASYLSEKNLEVDQGKFLHVKQHGVIYQ